MEDVDWVLVFVDFVRLIFDRLRFFYVARDILWPIGENL